MCSVLILEGSDNLKDVMFMEMIPTPEFWHTVLFMFPSELSNETILKDNLKNLPSLFKLYIKEKEMLEGNIQVLKHLKFKSQQDKQKEFINDCERVLKELSDKMDNGIAPYSWKMYTNIDTYDDESGRQIKADYVLALEK
jgi:hypothetical protein